MTENCGAHHWPAPSTHAFWSGWLCALLLGGGAIATALLKDRRASQALPGPLFNLAAYLGAVAGGVPGIFLCWVGLFGPGVMLIFGVLPIWGWFRDFRPYKLALPGLNSSAVGLVVAACFSLSLKVQSISPFSSATVIIGIVTFCMVHVAKMQVSSPDPNPHAQQWISYAPRPWCVCI
jgi:hypothetical protein